jgi:hypothetical protein
MFYFLRPGEENMRTTYIEPEIGKDDLIRLLGGRRGGAVSSSITRAFDTWSGKVAGLIEPHLSYLIRPIERIDTAGVTVNGVFFKSSRISRTLRECAEVVSFIATIDEGIEREVAALMGANKLSEAYILDSMGSVAIENMVNQFHAKMETEHRRQGRSVTIRFSPGYCDWDIAEQKKLFGLFDARNIPVTLRGDSYLMGPRKSISGLFGILPYDNGGIVASYNPCTECGKQGCIARRAARKV